MTDGDVSYLQVVVSFVQEECGRKVAVIGTRNVADNILRCPDGASFFAFSCCQAKCLL